MRSTASIKGHPIHAMLIPLPIGFFISAFGFDLAAVLLDRTDLHLAGGWLAAAGVAAGLLAAVPGAIDYFTTVPPESSARRRATKHALVNVGAVLLFAAGLVARGGIEAPATLVSLVVWAAALGLLTAGGWMGGTLVYRNQIGVDHRYAGAGRWSEARVEGERPAVARADELDVDQMKLIHMDGRRIVLARTADGYVAFDDACPHSGGSLAGGSMMCGTVQCPWHGSQFDVRDGALKAGPAEAGIRTYPVREADGELTIVT